MKVSKSIASMAAVAVAALASMGTAQAESTLTRAQVMAEHAAAVKKWTPPLRVDIVLMMNCLFACTAVS